jgi:hypothetical protein
VKRKGLVKGRGKNADAEARSVAFVVARAIARRGIKGKGVLKRALVKLKAAIQEALKREGF